MAVFDTSGRVRKGVITARGEFAFRPGFVRWDDLSPFEQGYVEALFAEPLNLQFGDRAHANWLNVGYSDLSPEALAMILRDCEAFQAQRAFDPLRGLIGPSGVESLRNAGREFWHVRSGREDYCHGFKPGDWPDFSAEPLNVAARGFPPLHVFLNDDGKVCLQQKEG